MTAFANKCSQEDCVDNEREIQGAATEAVDSSKKSGGRKRKRARELARILRDELPQAFARRGDLDAVSEDYGVAKTEVLAEAVLFLLRRPMGKSPTPIHVMRRTA